MATLPGLSEREMHYEEIKATSVSGMMMLVLNIILMLGAIVGLIYAILLADEGAAPGLWLSLFILSLLYLSLIGPLLFIGLKVLQP